MKLKQLLLACLVCLTPTFVLAQQPLPFNRVSPQASVKQFLGSFIHLEVNYSRPAKKDRIVWGELVPNGLEANPYGNKTPMPWRIGANENTTILLSHEAKVGETVIPAGLYSMHLIYEKTGSTFILNKDNAAWGAYFYNPANEVLRFPLNTTELSQAIEWLQITIEPGKDSELLLHIGWDKTQFSIPFMFDVHKITLAEYDKVLTNAAGFYPLAWSQAAAYCYTNNYNLDKGLVYIDEALNRSNQAVSHLFTKALILAKKGDTSTAESVEKTAIEKATDLEIKNYANAVFVAGNTTKAIEIHQTNVKKYAKSFVALEGLAEVQFKTGNKKEAKSTIEKAIKVAAETQKARLKKVAESYN